VASYGHQIDNVRVALHWAFSPEGDVEIGIALTVGALPLWMHLSLLEEGCAWVEQALSALGPDGSRDGRRAMQLYAAALSWELRCATSLARLWKDQGQTDKAREVLASAYEKFTEGFETADLKIAKALLDSIR